MDSDLGLIGFEQGVWINGYHWYYDPFDLYSDYTVGHYSEIYYYDTESISTIGNAQYQQSMFFLYGAISNTPNDPINPVPVPEPSSFCLFLAALPIVYFLNKVLTRVGR